MENISDIFIMSSDEIGVNSLNVKTQLRTYLILPFSILNSLHLAVSR